MPELLTRARQGDVAAFEELVVTHAPAVFGLIRRFVRDPQAAEEVLQETFIKAYQKLDTFRQEADFKTWLSRIAINQALMHQRAERPPLVDGELVPKKLADWSEDPQELYAEVELRDLLHNALEKLPIGLQQVFWLKEVEGFSNPEIARLLGLSLAAVKSRLLRARLGLREELAGYFAKGEK
ncbi:MAG: RNA polymerase sigma factor [Vulcanimicrobiota bacterium]